MSVTDGSQLQAYQNGLCLNMFYNRACENSTSRKLCTGGKDVKPTLKKIYVYTNKSTTLEWMGWNDTL